MSLVLQGNEILPKEAPCFLEQPSVCVALARELLTWSTADWTKVFNRFGSDGKKYVPRRPGEEFMPKCTIPSIKHGGGSVMVWVAFNRNGARILQDNLLPYSQSPDLNPIEHLRNDKQKPSNIKALEAIVKKAWAQISARRCANLVDSMPRRCNFGCPTKY
uniref:Transposable element Tc1 transposase n=1 Tax=Heterorhabditis bacteriophora TaxID=37862 RepID=A0A1I7WE78_HETBA